MKELSLDELKSIDLEILNHFVEFCKENDITYYLAYGTLLGAIRYKGFIPWDDDIDILVPREDYDRIIKTYKDGTQYRLYSIERNKKFGYPFAKLCDITTRKIDNYVDNGVDQGVEIDIFPLDYWDNDYEKAKTEVKRLKKYMQWLYISKIKTPNASTPLKLFVLKQMISIGRIFGTKYFISKIDKVCRNKNSVGGLYIGNKSCCPYGERDICSAKVFLNTVEVEFEGRKYWAPIGYDEYLTRLYGDYLPEPPKEKQKTHHKFKAYRLTEEEIQENT